MAKNGAPKRRTSTKDKLTKSSDAIEQARDLPQTRQVSLGRERLVTPAEAAAEYAARRRELNRQFERARKVLDGWWPQLQKRKDFIDGHLTGISVRFRTKFGHIVSPLQVAIVFNVQRKLCLEDLAHVGYPCLRSRGGIPVKVVEGGFQLLRQTFHSRLPLSAPPNPLAFAAELVGGAAIAPPDAHHAFGTLGIVIGSDQGHSIGLSAQHVVSGTVDQIGPQSATRKIGEVAASRPPVLNFNYNKITESLDCCLINLLSGSENNIRFPPPGAWVRGLESLDKSQPSIGQSLPVYFASRRLIESDRDFPIFKFGAGSGYLARGVLEAVDRRRVSINGVNYVNNFSVMLAEDGNRAFAAAGDSGSTLLLQAKVRGKPALIAVGILFASLENNSAVGIACNMSHVLRALNLHPPKVKTTSRWTR